MATHSSSILAWKFAWAEEAAGLQSVGSQRVGQTLATEYSHKYLVLCTGHYNTSQTLAMSSKLICKLIPNSQMDSSWRVCRVERYQKKFWLTINNLHYDLSKPLHLPGALGPLCMQHWQLNIKWSSVFETLGEVTFIHHNSSRSITDM